MKNVIRKMTTWMLVFGMTFTPVLTSIDAVVANAGEEKVTVTVGDQNVTFNNNDNLKSETKADVAGAVNANAKAATAEQAAADAAQAAADAATAATAAGTAADNAQAVADAAKAAADAIATQDSDPVATAEGLVDDAEDAFGDANDAIKNVDDKKKAQKTAAENANTAIGQYNQKVDNFNNNTLGGENGVNAAVEKANEDIGTAAGAKSKAVASYQDALGAIQDAKDAAVTDAQINAVKDKVAEAEQAYQDAETAVQGKIDTINKDLTAALLTPAKDENGEEIPTLVAQTQAAATAVSEAKGLAEQEDENAESALADTKANYAAIRNMVNAGSHDVEGAKKIAKEAAENAELTQQAANNAAAYAKAAATAEELAKTNYEAAVKALADAKEALKKANEDYADAFDAADDKADAADQEANTINGKINTYNNLVSTANTKIGTYEGDVDAANTAVNTANTSIATANDKIDTANTEKTEIASFKTTDVDPLVTALETAEGETQDAIDAVEGETDENGNVIEGKEGARAEALQAKQEAQEALDAAQGILDAAKAALEQAKKDGKTAAQYYEDAKAKAAEAAGKADGIAEQATIAETAANVTKDELAKITNNGKNYTDLQKEVADAETDLGNAQANLRKTTEEKNREIAGYEETKGQKEAEKTGLIGEVQTLEQAQSPSKTIVMNGDKKIDKSYYLGGLTMSWKTFTVEIERLRWVATNPRHESVFDNSRIFEAWEVQQAIEAVAAYDAAKPVYEEYQRQIEPKKTRISTIENTEIPALNTSISNAQQAIKEADDAVKTQQGILGDKQTNLAKVEDFILTEDNTVVLDLAEIQQYQGLIAKLSKDYYDKNDKYSYKYIDGMTTDLKDAHDAQLLGITLISQFFEGTPGQIEDSIEKHYGLSSWAWDYSDNKNYLVNKTNEKCVVVCQDIDQIAVIRATLAELQVAAAQESANEAKSAAAAAEARAKTAAEKEAAAQKAYNDALGDLQAAQEKLNGLSLNAYEEVEIPETTELKTAGAVADKLAPVSNMVKANLTAPADRVDQSVALTERGQMEERDLEELFEAAQAQLEEALKAYNAAKQAKLDADEEAACAKRHAEEAAEWADKAKKMAKRITPEEDTPDGPGPSDDGPGTGSGSSVVPGIVPLPSGPTLILPTGSAPSGVAGVRVADADAGEGEGEADAAEAPAPAVEENTQEVLEDADLPAAAEPTTIEDDDLAGAQTVEEAASMWWIWLLVILAALAGFGVYKYVDNKKKKAGTIDK